MPNPRDILNELSPAALGRVASALGIAVGGAGGPDLVTLASVPVGRLYEALEGLPGDVLASVCRGFLLEPSGPPSVLVARLLGGSSPEDAPPAAPQGKLPAGIAYSPEQQRVIAYRGGHLQVIASAGAGKTETIAQRVATLIDEGIEPRAIIAFTFTNEAAAGLKARVLRKAQERGPHVNLDWLSPMFVGTIHGFCLRFLQERVPRYATFDLYTDHRLVGLLTREYKSIGLDALGIHNMTEAIKAFLKTADAIENEMIAPSALPEGPFRTAYENYLATLDRYHVLTHNGCIGRAIDELGKPEVFEKFHATLRHLIVDEFQDINPAQARLISLMGRAPVHVCVVGDDDQSVYQFRGSSVHFIRKFAERFGAHTETLAVNRRSRSSIVETAAAFAKTIANRLPKEIRASRDDHPRAVTKFVAPDAKREAELIADAIESMHARGIPWKSIALLFRAMPSATPFLEVFDARKIPYRCEGRSALFLQPEIEALAHALAWMAGREDFWDPRKKQKVPVELGAVVKRIEQVFALPPPRAMFLSKILPVLKAALPEMQEADLVGLCYRLLSAMGVTEWDLEDPAVARRLGVLGRFSELLADYESVSRRSYKLLDREAGRRLVASGTAGGEHYLDGLVDYISYYAQDAYKDFTGEPDHEGDSVVFSTVHAAKGLEWPVVFVPCLSDQRFPSKFAGQKENWLVPRDAFPASRYEGSDKDERRLFYVAMTRARDHLYLSTHQKVTKKMVGRSPYFCDVGGTSTAVSNAAPWTPDEVPSKVGANDDKPTFSFSDLAQFHTCPLQYRMRKNLNFQPSGAKEMGYGRAVHHLMRRVAEHVRNFRELPDASDLDRLFDREFYLPYADRAAWETMETRARSLVEGYLRDFPEDLRRVWEVERPFELHLHEANVSGRADVILDQEGGVSGGLALVDYKTRRVAADDANLDLQLKAYTAAAQGEGFDVRAGYLHDLTASKSHARHKVDTAPQPVHEATVTLDSLAKRVRSRDYQPAPGTHCKACDVRPLCRHAQKPTEKD
jgi:DNA helicase-2/ATP-dependent DNA helicase PcrA